MITGVKTRKKEVTKAREKTESTQLLPHPARRGKRSQLC